jgi:hypothetical protein
MSGRKLLDLPEAVLVDVGSYLVESRLEDGDEEDLRRFTMASHRLRDSLRDPLNVCKLLSSPYRKRLTGIWHANLLIRLAYHPRWLADRRFLKFMLDYIARKDAATHPRYHIATPFSVQFIFERLKPFRHYNDGQSWTVAKSYALSEIAARFWFPAFDDPHWGSVGQMSVPLLHANEAMHAPESWLWETYCKPPGCHPHDVIDLIQLTSINDVPDTPMSTMRSYVEQCGCDGDSLRRAVEYRYFSGESMPRLRTALEELFPDWNERFKELKRIRAHGSR